MTCVRNHRTVYPRFYRSGASATGCRHQVTLGERYLDLHQNPVLGEERLPDRFFSF